MLVTWMLRLFQSCVLWFQMLTMQSLYMGLQTPLLCMLTHICLGFNFVYRLKFQKLYTCPLL